MEIFFAPSTDAKQCFAAPVGLTEVAVISALGHFSAKIAILAENHQSCIPAGNHEESSYGQDIHRGAAKHVILPRKTLGSCQWCPWVHI